MFETKIVKAPFSANLSALFVLALIGASFLVSPSARAQSLPGASKTAEISVFAGGAYTSADYGPTHNKGFTVGVDYTRFLSKYLTPSLEVRVNRTTGDIMTQEMLAGGLKLQADFSRFHPYATGLVGGAKIIFNKPLSPVYQRDTTFGYSAGGGVDFDLARHFQAKIDFQQEFWNFGPNGTLRNNADFTLTPNVLTFGIAYRIPLRANIGQGR